MKLDIACVRDILLYVESLPFNSMATIMQLHEKYPHYSDEELEYNCLKLIEGQYLEGITVSVRNSPLPRIKCILCMTFEGHQFLETIRPETIFEKTKNALSNVGTFSFDVVTKVGTTYLSQLVTSALNM